jgi:hypothetical protein
MLIIRVFAVARCLLSRSLKKKVPAFGNTFCRPGLGKGNLSGARPSSRGWNVTILKPSMNNAIVLTQ